VSGRLSLAAVVAATVSTLLSGCDTYHVRLARGDCVTAGSAPVGCDQPSARFRVVDIRRAEGSYPVCPAGQTTATFTEGGDGPMIGVAVCLEPIGGPAPS
jgi:hypothetical protein